MEHKIHVEIKYGFQFYSR